MAKSLAFGTLHSLIMVKNILFDTKSNVIYLNCSDKNLSGYFFIRYVLPTGTVLQIVFRIPCIMCFTLRTLLTLASIFLCFLAMFSLLSIPVY